MVAMPPQRGPGLLQDPGKENRPGGLRIVLGAEDPGAAGVLLAGTDEPVLGVLLAFAEQVARYRRFPVNGALAPMQPGFRPGRANPAGGDPA